MPKASIVLADDNSYVLDHVRRTLEQNQEFTIVAALHDGGAVVQECARLKPDVIVLDISMGKVSGIDVAQALRDSGCVAKIVFLTVHEDHDFMKAALGAGGSGYVVKSRLGTDLVSAIHSVLLDKLFISASMMVSKEKGGAR